MAGHDLENLIASFMLGRAASLPYSQWPEAIAAAIRKEYVLAERDGSSSTPPEPAPTGSACTHPACRCPSCNYWPNRT